MKVFLHISVCVRSHTSWVRCYYPISQFCSISRTLYIPEHFKLVLLCLAVSSFLSLWFGSLSHQFYCLKRYITFVRSHYLLSLTISVQIIFDFYNPHYQQTHSADTIFSLRLITFLGHVPACWAMHCSWTDYPAVDLRFQSSRNLLVTPVNFRSVSFTSYQIKFWFSVTECLIAHSTKFTTKYKIRQYKKKTLNSKRTNNTRT